MNCIRSWLLDTRRQGVKALGIALQRNITFESCVKEIVLPGRNFIYKNKEKKSVPSTGISVCNQVLEYHSGRRGPDASPGIRDAHPFTPPHSIELSNESQKVKQRFCTTDSREASEAVRKTGAHHTYIGYPTKSHGNTTLGPPDVDSSDTKLLQLPQVKNEDGSREHSSNNITIVDNVVVSEHDGDWTREMEWVVGHETRNVLTPPTDTAEVDVLAPELRPTFNLAAYVNNSSSLQEMVKLGVDLSRWDKKKGVANFILRLDFNANMKHYIRFLHDAGVKAEDLGRWLSINPYIFKEDLSNLEARVGYLADMAFTKDQVARIITRNPNWLLFSTVKIDTWLGFFQRTFKLSGDEVRTLATREPRIITAKLYNIKRTNFAVLEEMGFNQTEMKSLLLTRPKIWLAHGVSLLRRFDYAHNTMGLTHSQLVQFPHVLLSRDFRLQQRHSFLRCIGRAQYDPSQPGYVSPQQLVAGDDVAFCSLVAKTSIQDFNDFLKTL